MLFKLMKHEILSSYRLFIPLYIVSIIGSALLAVSVEIESDLLLALSVSMIGLIMILLAIFTLYTIMINFGQRMFGKPGYLLFTTPSTTLQIISSKVIINLMWLILSFIAGVISGVVFLAVFLENDFFVAVESIWRNIADQPQDFIRVLISLLMTGLYLVTFILFLFSLLNLIYKGERKIVVGVMLYLGLSILMNVISRLIFGSVSNASIFGVTSSQMFWQSSLLNLVFSIAFFVSSYFIIEKKLELQ